MTPVIAVVWVLTLTKSSSSSQLMCQEDFRLPVHTDISVECGTSTITLAILVCPVINMGYNESLLILNHIFNKPECTGTLDKSTTPPVVRFTIPLNMSSTCGSTLVTTSAAGTGIYADFSSIHTLNVSGVVHSYDPTTEIVTYNTELKYYYSCAYPLEYLINSTQVDVTAASIAVTDGSGTFLSTLSMEFFSDANYTSPLVMPPLGLQLKTKIHVQVKASNLTAQYHVLMNRCYASTSPYPINSTFVNLFVLCSNGKMTSLHENGVGHRARFSFSAFRFSEHQKHSVSIYYLHCFSQLCQHSTCNGFTKCKTRLRRGAETTGVSEDTSLLMLPLVIRNENSLTTTEEAVSGSDSDSRSGLEKVIGGLALALASLWI